MFKCPLDINKIKEKKALNMKLKKVLKQSLLHWHQLVTAYRVFCPYMVSSHYAFIDCAMVFCHDLVIGHMILGHDVILCYDKIIDHEFICAQGKSKTVICSVAENLYYEVFFGHDFVIGDDALS